MQRLIRASCLALLLTSPAATADSPNLVTRGFALAERDCGACHATGINDKSPHRITPPFRDLAKRFPIPMLSEARKSGSIAGHDEMPGFDYGLDDIRALLGYIDSLAPADKKYLGLP